MNTNSPDERRFLNNIDRIARALEGINNSLGELTQLSKQLAESIPAPVDRRYGNQMRGFNAQDDIATEDYE